MVGGQALGSAVAARGPPGEATPRQAFVAQPKPLAIVGQQLQRRPLAIAEDEDRAGAGIVLEPILTQSRQAVDAAAEIGRLDSY